MRQPGREIVKSEVTAAGNRTDAGIRKNVGKRQNMKKRRNAGNRPGMSREDRAKQFMPFAALKGYEEALREKEKIVVPRMELSEEMKEQLDRRLPLIRQNDIITVVYYHQDQYLKLTGMVSRIDLDARILKIVNTKIPFGDIVQILGEQFGREQI